MAPVVSWTPSERWLLEVLGRQALVVRGDGAAPERPLLDVGADGRMPLPLPRGPVIVTLAPRPALGHPWRERWALKLVRGGAQLFLDGAQPEGRLDGSGDAGVALLVRGDMAACKPVEGAARVPLVDAALGKHTRESTAGPEPNGELAPFMTPTAPEAQPWWEVDLGTPMYLESVTLWLAPTTGELTVHAYAFGTPKQEPPPEGWRARVALTGKEARLRIEVGSVARYLRVELAAPAGETRVLALTAVEALAAEVFAATLLATYQRAFSLFADRPLFREPGGEHWRSYAEVWDEACALAAGLAQRLEPATGRVFLGLCMKNRREWVAADLAAIQRGYAVVPLPPDEQPERLSELIARADIRCLVCEPRHVEALRALCPALVFVVCDGDYDEVCARGRAAGRLPPAQTSDDELYTLLFTSGSSGTPKAATRSYAAFHAMLRIYGVVQPAVHLSFQPLSHLSERMQLPTLIIQGGQAAFAGDNAELLAELAALEPTFVFSVPRLYEVLHARYQRKLRREPAREAELLAEARLAFGRRLQSVAVGSAPCSPEVLAFLRRCFADIWVTEGYGSTECGTIAIDGRIQADVEVKLVAVPALGYSPEGEPPRGEIWVKTRHHIGGYLGDDAATRDSFDADGFFHTGDLGERRPDGGVVVIGRLKSTVKLAQGEFVAPDRIETALGGAALVDRIFVHASSQGGVRAVVVPDREALARALEVDPAAADLCLHPRASQLVLRALASRGREAGLAGYELPTAVLLTAEPMTVENGLLTASGKLCREHATRRYARELEALSITVAPAGEGLPARVAAIVAEVVGRPVDPHAPLSQALAVDSLAAAEVMTALSEQLGRPVPLRLWFEAATLADLCERLDHGAAPDDALGREDLLRAPALACVGAAVPLRRVLLTGATGFLGAHLLEALGAHDVEVLCLVRGGPERLAAVLARYDIAPARAPRVVTGDLAAPRLGLDDVIWERLAAELDGVIHAGAVVSWLSRYEQLREPNVLGTLALLELAATARPKAFHFVSTISTAPADGDEHTTLSFAEAAAGSGYGLSKWLAETHVRRAGDAGLPAVIYRPAMIAGHSRRGHGNGDDFVNRYLRACAESGLYLDVPGARLDMTPVDFVAEAITTLAMRAPTGGPHHLCNVDRSLSYAGLGAALVAAGVACKPASYAAFREALPRTALRPLAAYFPAEGFALGMGPWPSARSRALLASLGVLCPPVDQRLIDTYVAALQLGA